MPVQQALSVGLTLTAVLLEPWLEALLCQSLTQASISHSPETAEPWHLRHGAAKTQGPIIQSKLLKPLLLYHGAAMNQDSNIQSVLSVVTIALYPGAAVNQDSNSPSVLLEPLLCTLGQPWIRTQTVLQCCWNHCFVPWGSRESGLKQSFSAVGTICFCKIAPGDHCFRKCMWCFGLSLLLHLSFLPLLFLLFDSSSF